MQIWKLLAWLTLCIGPASTGWTQNPVSSRDAAAVNGLLVNYADGWRRGDAERMFAAADADIHWVNVVGMHWIGKAQVVQAHDTYLKSIFRNVPLRLEQVESVVPLGNDSLVVVARWAVGSYVTPTGFKAPAARNRMTLVLRRRSGGLGIAHVANIEVNERAAASDPIRK